MVSRGALSGAKTLRFSAALLLVGGSAASRTSRSLTQPAVAKRVSRRAGKDAGRFARLILSPTPTRLAIVYVGREADIL